MKAEEFDEKFDKNEDISEHLDFSKSIRLKDFNLFGNNSPTLGSLPCDIMRL